MAKKKVAKAKAKPAKKKKAGVQPKEHISKQEAFGNWQTVLKSDDGNIIEFKPQARVLPIVNNTKGKKVHYLALPYVQFCTTGKGGPRHSYGSSLFITFSQESILENPDATTYHCMLPDVGVDGRVTLGCQSEGVYQLETLIKHFWTQKMYTHNSGPFTSLLKECGINNFKNWEDKTKKNPNFILKAKLAGEIPLPGGLAKKIDRRKVKRRVPTKAK